jgi:DNA-directed RNA polymerase subunit M/transcription elongation factor TFIIS
MHETAVAWIACATGYSLATHNIAAGIALGAAFAVLWLVGALAVDWLVMLRKATPTVPETWEEATVARCERGAVDLSCGPTRDPEAQPRATVPAPRYDEDNPCPKCGHDRATSVYVAPGSYHPDEGIRRTCQRCSFRWVERPLDAAEAGNG